MINSELSDLFFNYPHPRYEELLGRLGPDAPAELIESCLRRDAYEFVESYPLICGFVTPSELADNFLNRL